MESTPAQPTIPSVSSDSTLEDEATPNQEAVNLASNEADSNEDMPINEESRRENLYKMSKKDEILPVFRVGQRVRLTKTIRNDGTYPMAKNGDILLEPGAEGYVRKIGDFLQVIRIYEVNFFEQGLIFGCREAELEPAEESDGYDEVEEELRWMREHRAKRAAEKAAAQSQEEGE